MPGILQKPCRRQSGDPPADDRHVARGPGGGKPLLHDAEELRVIGVLQALKKGISKNPPDSEHHQADQSQRN